MSGRGAMLVALTLLVAGCGSNRSSDDPTPDASVQERVDSAAARMGRDTMMDSATAQPDTGIR
ncbi:MAG: hypothetical protein M3Q75_06795 [Gemmatimonadota bacterium]|nr:hypothetical protein [Gemmatimonadota bacterium]